MPFPVALPYAATKPTVPTSSATQFHIDASRPGTRDRCHSSVRAAKIEGKTSSEVIRALVEDYLRQRDVGAYVDSLWERFGKDFKARKLTAKDIPAAIKASRKSRKENAGRS